MPERSRVLAFDLDANSLVSLHDALPKWKIDAVEGVAAASLTDEINPATADLLIIGAGKDMTKTLALCRELRSQSGRAATPLLVLVPPAQPALIDAALKAGANGCLVLPTHAKTLASSVARSQQGNQPGRHTLNLDRAQRQDEWRDDGGQG
jgi:PleD family two-component response regulator